MLKCPYYGLWKVHILVLGIPNNRLTCMQGQKTLSFSYNTHLFLPYLLIDSQTIRSTINFSKPLFSVTLICGDWSISFKAVFVSSVLLCVQCYRGNRYFNAPKAAPSGKEWICIFIQTKTKRPTSGGQYANISFDVKWNGLGFVLKRLVSMIQSRLFLWETITLYTLHFKI